MYIYAFLHSSGKFIIDLYSIPTIGSSNNFEAT